MHKLLLILLLTIIALLIKFELVFFILRVFELKFGLKDNSGILDIIYFAYLNHFYYLLYIMIFFGY